MNKNYIVVDITQYSYCFLIGYKVHDTGESKHPCFYNSETNGDC